MNRKKVVVGIIIENNEVYLLRHNKCKGLFVFPSGKVEDGETIEEALIREMKEELNIDVLNYEPILKYKPQWYDRVDGVMHTEEYVYIITEYKGIPINNEPTKHLELVKRKTDEIINNPKEYTYSSYEYAELLNVQYEI